MAFSRIKRWTKEKLKFRDLNAEFDNVISNFTVAALDGLNNANAAENPVDTVGSPVSGSTAENDIKRLRWMIAKLFGLDYYYRDPGRNLQAASDDLLSFVNFNGANASETLVDVIRRGAVINALRWSNTDFDPVNDASLLDTGTVNYGRYSFKAGANRVLAIPGSLISSGSLQVVWKGLSDGDYLAYNPLLGLALYRSGTHIKAELTRPDAASDYLKGVSSATGTTDITVPSTFIHTLFSWFASDSAANDFLTTHSDGSADGSLADTLNIAPQLTGDASARDFGAGVWFFGVKPSGIAWQKFLAMDHTPDALLTAGDRWLMYKNDGSALTSGTTPTIAQAAAQGVLQTIDVATVATNAALRIACASSRDTLYKAPVGYVDLSNQTIEAKVRVLSSDLPFGGADICNIYDNSVNSSGKKCFLRVRLRYDGYLEVSASQGGTSKRLIQINSQQYNVIRVTSIGSPHPTVSIYVNGVKVYSFLNDAEDTGYGGSTNLLLFGCQGNLGNPAVDFEYYAVKGNGAALAPFAPNGTGFIDEVALIRGTPVTSVIASLAANSAAKVYGRNARPGVYVQPEIVMPHTSITPVQSGLYVNGNMADSETYFVSDGGSPVDFYAEGNFVSAGVDSRVYMSVDGTPNQSNTGKFIGNTATLVTTMVGKTQAAAGLHSLGFYIGTADSDTATTADGRLGVHKSRSE